MGAIGAAEAGATTVGSPVVVKLGGTTIAEQQDILREIVEERQRRPVVVVHGGGKRLTEWLDRLGVTSRFEAGRRVTDDATLEVFLAVMGGVINAELTAELLAPRRGRRGRARHRRPHHPGDAGRGARPRHRRARGRRLAAASRCWRTAGCPCWHRMGLDAQGHVCNVNADDAAAAVSAALGGELVLMTDTDGVRDADGRRIEELTPGEAERLIVGRGHLRGHGAEGPIGAAHAGAGFSRGASRHR